MMAVFSWSDKKPDSFLAAVKTQTADAAYRREIFSIG